MALAGANVSRASTWGSAQWTVEDLHRRFPGRRNTRFRRSVLRSLTPPRSAPRRPTALVVTLVVLALLALSPFARADCECSVPRVEVDGVSRCPPGAVVTCDVETFGRTVDALLQAEHDRDVALAANKRLEEELRVRITPVEVSVWPWVAGGVVLGLVVGVVLAR